MSGPAAIGQNSFSDSQLLVAVNLVQRLAAATRWNPEYASPPTLRLGPVAAVFAGCILATFISPYSYHLYEIAYGYASAKFPYKVIGEMQRIFETSSAGY